MNAIVSFTSRLFVGCAELFVSDWIVTSPPTTDITYPVAVTPPILKFVTVFTSKNTVSSRSVTTTSYAVASPVFETTSDTVVKSPPSIRFVLNDVPIQILGSTFVTTTAGLFVTAGSALPAKFTRTLFERSVCAPATRPVLPATFCTTASTYTQKLLSPVLLFVVTTVALLNTSDAPLAFVVTLIGEPSVPPKTGVVTSTRFVMYCIPAGNRSITTRLLTVPSGSVTTTLYVTISPIWTF